MCLSEKEIRAIVREEIDYCNKQEPKECAVPKHFHKITLMGEIFAKDIEVHNLNKPTEVSVEELETYLSRKGYPSRQNDDGWAGWLAQAIISKYDVRRK